MAIREPGGKNSLDRAERAYEEKLDPLTHAHQNLQKLREHEQQAATENGGTSVPGVPQAVRDAEKESWKTRVTAPPAGKRKASGSAWTKTKRRLPLLILLFGLVTGGSMLSFMGVALAPVAFFANVFENDLNDQLAALEKRSLGIMLKRTASVSGADRSKAIAGCRIVSIRCKYQTMPKKLVENFRGRGIEIIGEPGGVFGNRVKPEKFKFQNREYTAAEFSKALKDNPDLSRAYRRTMNMKYSGLQYGSFLSRVLPRFGISTRDPILTGSHEDRVNKLMNAAGVNNATKLSFTEIFEQETDPATGLPKVDPVTNEPILKSKGFKLDGGDPTKIYSKAQKVGFEKSIARATAVKAPPSSLKANSLKAISVLGVYDAACSAKNFIGAASVAAKVANSHQLASYAMPLASLAGKLKAGDLSAQDGQVLGEFFMATDKRKTIPDASNAYELSGDQMTARDEIPTMPNPNYGKNAMDSPLYQMSAYGGVAPATSEALTYSLGMGQNTLLSTFASSADLFSKVLNLGDLGGCQWVQNWAVRGVGFIGGIVLGAGTGGLSIGATVLMMGAVTAGMLLLNHMVSSALSGSIISPDMAEKPIERSNALWSGMAVLAGEVARTRGMMPANKQQIIAYQQTRNEVVQDYIALEKHDAKPWDITNPYSTIGSVAFALRRYAPRLSAPSSMPSGVFSAIADGFASPFSPYTSYAASLDPARFTRCDDQAYRDLGIDADVQCNVRYVMPKEEMDADPLAVAQYMEDGGYVEKDTTTGLPKGYAVRDPRETQTLALAVAQGLIGDFVSLRSYGATDAAREYGKFLDFCAYRSLPFGETYEETGAFGDAGLEWKSGKKCMEESEMIRNFRIYTFDKSTIESMDSEGGPEPGDPLDGALAIAYTEPNFQGEALRLIGLEKLDMSKMGNNGNWTNRIASVRVSPGVSLTFYNDNDLEGRNVTYTEDASDIGAPRWPSSYRATEGWGGQPPVVVYDQPDFKGYQKNINENINWVAANALFGTLGAKKDDKRRIWSIRIPPGHAIRVYQIGNYGGDSMVLTGDVPDLSKVLPWVIAVGGSPRAYVKYVVSSMRLLSDGAGPPGTGTPTPGLWANPMGSQNYQYVSGYGPRVLGGGFHYGDDLVIGSGDFYAACDGKVSSISNNGDINTISMGNSGIKYSNIMTVDCGNGIKTVYMHYYYRDVPSNIRVGTQVTAGTKLGKVGNQGFSLGTHLHFEVHRTPPNQNPGLFVQTQAVEPDSFMRARGVNLRG